MALNVTDEEMQKVESDLKRLEGEKQDAMDELITAEKRIGEVKEQLGNARVEIDQLNKQMEEKNIII